MEKAGAKLQERKKKLGLSDVRICAEADDLSINTLRAVFRDEPNVRPGTIARVKRAIDRLEARGSESKAVG